MVRRRIYTMVAAVMLLVGLVVPAAGAEDGSPFEGRWLSWDIFDDDSGDGSLNTMVMRGDQHLRFNWIDDGATFCDINGFGFVQARVNGRAAVSAGDPDLAEGHGRISCWTGTGWEMVTTVPVSFAYDPATDTMSTPPNCWYRAGADPAVCGIGSD